MQTNESVTVCFSGIDGVFEVPLNDATREAMDRLYVDEAGNRVATGTADAEFLLSCALKREITEPEPITGELAGQLMYLEALMERLQGDMEQARELVTRLRRKTSL